MPNYDDHPEINELLVTVKTETNISISGLPFQKEPREISVKDFLEKSLDPFLEPLEIITNSGVKVNMECDNYEKTDGACEELDFAVEPKLEINVKQLKP